MLSVLAPLVSPWVGMLHYTTDTVLSFKFALLSTPLKPYNHLSTFKINFKMVIKWLKTNRLYFPANHFNIACDVALGVLSN